MRKLLSYFTFFLPTTFAKSGLYCTLTAELEFGLPTLQLLRNHRSIMITLLGRTALEEESFWSCHWLLSLHSWPGKNVFIFSFFFFFCYKYRRKQYEGAGIGDHRILFKIPSVSKQDYLKWELKLRHFEANHMSF